MYILIGIYIGVFKCISTCIYIHMTSAAITPVPDVPQRAIRSTIFSVPLDISAIVDFQLTRIFSLFRPFCT